MDQDTVPRACMPSEESFLGAKCWLEAPGVVGKTPRELEPCRSLVWPPRIQPRRTVLPSTVLLQNSGLGPLPGRAGLCGPVLGLSGSTEFGDWWACGCSCQAASGPSVYLPAGWGLLASALLLSPFHHLLHLQKRHGVWAEALGVRALQGPQPGLHLSHICLLPLTSSGTAARGRLLDPKSTVSPTVITWLPMAFWTHRECIQPSPPLASHPSPAGSSCGRPGRRTSPLDPQFQRERQGQAPREGGLGATC